MEISMIDDCWYLLPDNDGRCDQKSKKKKGTKQTYFINLTSSYLLLCARPKKKKPNQKKDIS